MNTSLHLVDSHCHLDFPDFQEDLPSIIANARRAGVTRMLTICTRMPQFAQVQAISERFEGVYFAAANHPLHVTEVPLVSLDALLNLAKHPKFIAIGETGLDYFYSADSKARQKESLLIHIEAARQTNLPLIIHARAADKDIAHILTQEYHAAPFQAVMHCFSSGRALAKQALELGFYISMSGIATFPKSGELRDIFAHVPLDRILVETDAPYLAPPPYRGKRNEPAYTVETAKIGADIFGLSLEDFATQTTRNFDRLFTKAIQSNN